MQRLLAAMGIDVNVQDCHGDSALMRAANDGHIPVVELLLMVDGIDCTSGGFSFRFFFHSVSAHADGESPTGPGS